MEYDPNATPATIAYVKRVVKSSCCFMRKEDLRREMDGTFSIVNLTVYGNSMDPPLCPTERFWNQINPAFCSGVAVSPTLILSAGHCPSLDENVWQPSTRNLVVVFGFGLIAVRKPDGSLVAEPRIKGYTSDEVFGYDSPLQIVNGQITGNKDWSCIRLPGGGLMDALNRTSKVNLLDMPRLVAQQDSVFVVGYPSGLPVKWTGSGVIGRVEPDQYVTNLDTFGGNSGSPVYSYIRENTVFGLLYQGQPDFVTVGQCQKSATVPDAQGKADDLYGEDALDVHEVLKVLSSQNPTVYQEIVDWTDKLGSSTVREEMIDTVAHVWLNEVSTLATEMDEHQQYVRSLVPEKVVHFDEEETRSVASSTASSAFANKNLYSSGKAWKKPPRRPTVSKKSSLTEANLEKWNTFEPEIVHPLPPEPVQRVKRECTMCGTFKGSPFAKTALGKRK
jgi:V8-like Glu-specific endopeptidase